MTFDLAYQIAGLVGAASIILVVEPTIDKMSRCTNPLVKFSYIAMAAAALAMITRILFGHVPTCESLLLFVAVAVFLLSDRRKCDLKRRMLVD